MQLAVQSDAEHDVLYLAFSRRALAPRSVKRTLRVSDDISLDFGVKGTLLGMEVLNASRALGQAAGDVSIDSLIGVKEAAALLGLQRSNFVRDHANNPAFPAPVAELATGRIWLRSQVDAYAPTLRSRRKTASKSA